MSNHLLTTQERRRFVQYCREEAESYRLLLGQVEKLNPMVAEVVGREHKKLIAAYSIVADHLDSAEEQSISG